MVNSLVATYISYFTLGEQSLLSIIPLERSGIAAIPNQLFFLRRDLGLLRYQINYSSYGEIWDCCDTKSIILPTERSGIAAIPNQLFFLRRDLGLLRYQINYYSLGEIWDCCDTKSIILPTERSGIAAIPNQLFFLHKQDLLMYMYLYCTLCSQFLEVVIFHNLCLCVCVCMCVCVCVCVCVCE